MQKKIIKLVNLYIKRAEELNIKWKGKHSFINKYNVGAFIPDDYKETYGEIRAFGIALNIVGKLEVDYPEDKENFYPIDIDKWMRIVEDILLDKRNPEDYYSTDFELNFNEQVNNSPDPSHDEEDKENKVKAEILDSLLKRDLNINKEN